MKTRLLSLAFALSSFTALHAQEPNEVTVFNGLDLNGWAEPHGAWSVVGGVQLSSSDPKSFEALPGQGMLLNTKSGRGIDLYSKEEFGDCEIHVEFCVTKGSNSGVYVQGRYEVQILDSYGKAKIDEHDCGAIYQRWKDNKGYEGHPPLVNASKAPGEWQSFDIYFRAPRFNAAGEKIENGRFLKVVQNGQVVQENVEVTGPTRGSRYVQDGPTGPIMLQGDHGPVAFRKFRVIRN